MAMNSPISLDNVERTKSPPAATFTNEIVAKQRPVILTDLFAGEQILELCDLSQATACLKGIQLRAIKVTENFLQQAKAQTCTLDEYRRLITDNPSHSLWCYQPLPPVLATMFSLPACIDTKTHDISALLYISSPRLRLSLHFDVDFKQNLTTQLLGYKRYILINPRLSKRLSPYFNYSAIALAHYSEAEKLAFVEYNDGFDCILSPGETLFIPKSWWHYVEYLSFSISVSLRYATAPFNQVLTLLPRSYLLQNVANALVDESQGVITDEQHYKLLIDSYYRSAPNARALYNRFYHTKEHLYAILCPQSLQGKYVCDVLNQEYRRLKSGRFLWGPLVCPIFYDGDDADAPISHGQLKAIRDLSKQWKDATPGAPYHTFTGGKRPLELLTTLEAAQCLDRLARFGFRH